MVSAQTYRARDQRLRIQIVIKGPVLVRFGTYQIRKRPQTGEGAAC